MHARVTLSALLIALSLTAPQRGEGQVPPITSTTSLPTTALSSTTTSTTTTTLPLITTTTTTPASTVPPTTTTTTTTTSTLLPLPSTTSTTLVPVGCGPRIGIIPRPNPCEDGVPCTEDSCANGTCVHTPVDARCDRAGECAVRSCRPDDPGADANGCVTVPVGTGNTCTDDGFACTDDVCGPAGCLHVPVDSRCVSPGECTDAVCAPERADHDAAGCARGQPAADGEECAEDGDPCTLDVCRNGACAHEEVPHPVTCTPVQGAFRRALALQSLARLLMTDGAARVESSAAPLRRVDASLGAAARALAGKSVAGVAGRPLPAVFTETPATERARTAFTMVLRTPGQVTAFLQTLAQARLRALLGRAVNRDLRRRGRLLLQGTRKLKAELRWLQQLTATFAR